MIVFNELRIDSDKNLIIDASVLDTTTDPEDHIQINHAHIGAGSNQELIDLIDTPYIDKRYNSDGYVRGIRIVLDLTNDAVQTLFDKVGEDLTKLLYYIQVSVELPVELEVTTDCSVPREIEGYAYDKCLLMNKVFDYIKSTDDICNNLDDYANYIVKINGLQLAVESGNFTLANTYWNKFFANNNSNVGLISNTGCGCHR